MTPQKKKKNKKKSKKGKHFLPQQLFEKMELIRSHTEVSHFKSFRKTKSIVFKTEDHVNE
jgi:hypothetical protein